jgi:hypothetical protein
MPMLPSRKYLATIGSFSLNTIRVDAYSGSKVFRGSP